MRRITYKEKTDLHSLNTQAGRRHVKAPSNGGLYNLIRRIVQIDTIPVEKEKKHHLAVSKNPTASVIHSQMLAMFMLTVTFMPVALFSDYQNSASETHKVVNEMAEQAGFKLP